jgi:hypothetical protein
MPTMAEMTTCGPYLIPWLYGGETVAFTFKLSPSVTSGARLPISHATICLPPFRPVVVICYM